MVIGLDGKMTGLPGFARGTVSRLSAGFTDIQMQHQSFSDSVCKGTQTFNNYSDEFPALRARPGEFIAIQYQENGHVTLPDSTPQKPDSGTVYVYGSSVQLEDPALASIHGIWTEQSNGAGKLLAKCQFDDGQCYQINGGSISRARQITHSKIPADPQGADLWCQCDLRLPFDVQDVYTLYWVWDWPSFLGGRYESEIYTSCLDVFLTPDVQKGSLIYAQDQDLNVAGIEKQLRALE